MPVTQWVNLTKDAKWALNAETTACLGEVEVKLTFQNAARADVKYQLLPQAGNAVYTQGEQDKADAFKTDESVRVAQTGLDGTVVVRLPLPAAGGGKFKVKGWKPGFLGYKGQSQTTGEFLAARRIFYRFAAMPGVPALDLAAVEASYWDEAKKLYVQLAKVGGDVALNDAPMFYDPAGAYPMKDEIDHASPLGEKSALAFTIALVHRVGTEKAQFVQQVVTRTIPPATQALGVITLRVTGVGPLYTPPNDLHQSWLRLAKYAYVDLAGQTQTGAVARSDVTLVDATTVDVKLRPSDLRGVQLPAADNPLAITLSLDLMAVVELSGIAYPGLRLTILATEKAGGVFGVDRIKVAAIHEIGHLFGMVPDARSPLTPPPHAYAKQNHIGPHCAIGAAFAAAAEAGAPGTWTGDPGCVMFGAALRDGASGPLAPDTYCADCEKLVRKVNLARLG